MRNRFLLLRDRFQHISGTGNVREINLGLDFLLTARCVGSPARLRVAFRYTTNVRPHFFCFMFFEGTGVSLLLRDSDNREHIKNGLAFNFQLSCEIVDSNLTHPPFPVLRVVTRSSLRPHGVSSFALACDSHARCHYSVVSGAG